MQKTVKILLQGFSQNPHRLQLARTCYLPDSPHSAIRAFLVTEPSTHCGVYATD